MENPQKYSPSVLGMEYLRRKKKGPGSKIQFPADVATALKKYLNKEQEYFFTITLNGDNEVITINLITIGLVDKTLIHPREVFRKAIQQNAVAIIVAHNHPSGNIITPSVDDKRVTIKIKKAGKILGIEVLDHLIFCKDDYYSFLENGDM